LNNDNQNQAQSSPNVKPDKPQDTPVADDTSSNPPPAKSDDVIEAQGGPTIAQPEPKPEPTPTPTPATSPTPAAIPAPATVDKPETSAPVNTDMAPPAEKPAANPADKANKSVDFPFKPIQNQANDPQIGVDFDKPKNATQPEVKPATKIPDAKIDMPDYEGGQKSNADKPDSIIQTNNIPHNNSALIYTAVALLFIALGFGGGFLGFKYSPKIAKMFTSTADTTTKATDTITQPVTKNATPGDISVWPIYTNSKYLYSVNYPDNWYAEGLNDKSAFTVAFSSYDPTNNAASTTGFKVEIIAQSSNNETLQNWITENNTTANTTLFALSPVKIAGQDGYQQKVTSTSQIINSYVLNNNQVITITYTGPLNDTAGPIIYNNILSTIKFSS
jgi:hypothetical protein